MVGEHKPCEQYDGRGRFEMSLVGSDRSYAVAVFGLLCLVGLGVVKLMTGPYRLCRPHVHEVAADWTDVTNNRPLLGGRVRVVQWRR